MKAKGLRFTREKSYVLAWDVMEGEAYCGALEFFTDDGWVFTSSDDSIRWKLGTNVRDAKSELRRRYRAGQVASEPVPKDYAPHEHPARHGAS